MSQTSRLLSARLLSGNVIWSLTGAGLPLLVGLWAIPELISGLGKERFGLLAIIWMGIGYFSLFDLGIGRALTKLVAERLGLGEDRSLPELIRVGLRLMWLLGLVAAAAMFVFSPVLIEQVLKVPGELQREGTVSFWILAAVLPFVVNTAGLIGILQAHQRFRAMTVIRLPLGVVNFLGPTLILPITDSLIATTAVLAISRIAAWFAYHTICLPYVRRPKEKIQASQQSLARELLTFGGWITVSNVISPMMVYFDRLLIGSILGLTAVAFYTTPYEIVTRLWIIPGAITDVLFPALAVALVANLTKAKKIYVSALLAQAIIMLPVLAILILFAPELLGLWLGEEFAVNSAEVLRWLALGVFINSFARMPFALLQGNGRPDITAMLHLIELPLYLFALWWLMGAWGLKGAAVAWTARIAFDTLVLFGIAARIIPEIRDIQYKSVLVVMVMSSILVALWAANSLPYKVFFFGVMLLTTSISMLALSRFIPSLRLNRNLDGLTS